MRTHVLDRCLGQKIITRGERMTMTGWTDLLVDVAPVKAIFGLKPPRLEGISLHEIIIHRDGPRVLLRFDLADFPLCPPQKWAAAGVNRVQVRLLALGVQELKIAGLQSKIQIDLGLKKVGSLIRLSADNGTVQLDLGAEAVAVENISAYRETGSEQE